MALQVDNHCNKSIHPVITFCPQVNEPSHLPTCPLKRCSPQPTQVEFTLSSFICQFVLHWWVKLNAITPAIDVLSIPGRPWICINHWVNTAPISITCGELNCLNLPPRGLIEIIQAPDSSRQLNLVMEALLSDEVNHWYHRRQDLDTSDYWDQWKMFHWWYAYMN